MKKKPAPTTRPSERKTPRAARPAVKKTARPAAAKTVRQPSPPAATPPWLNDKLFRTLIENSSEALALSDPKGKILYRSPSAKVISGTPDFKILSANMFDRIWPEDMKPARKFFEEMLKNPEKKVAFQIRVRGKTGKPQWIDGIGVNWLARPGLQALVLHYRDVTEAKEAAAALEESERRYRSLFENARLAVFQSTPDGKVIQVNNEFARIFGYRSPEDVAHSVRDVGKDLFADPARRLEIIRMREKDPRLTAFDNLYQRKDGSTFWGRLTVRSETDAKGKILHFEGFIEDITKNRAMEESLRESEEKFRSMFQNSAAGEALVGLDGRYLMVNPVLCEILGYPAKELLAMDFFKLTHPGDVEISRKAMLGVLEGKGKNVRFEKRYIHKDGHTIWTEISSALVSDAGGKPSHFVTQVIDITKRKRAEEALRESEAYYRALVDASPVAVTVTDLNGTIQMCNAHTAALLGHERPEDLVGRNAFEFFAPDEVKRAGANLQRTLKDGIVRNIEYRLAKKDGSWFPAELTAALIPNAEGKPAAFMAVVHDISERRQAEEALRESEERYRGLFQNSLEGIGLSKGNQIIDANKALLEIFGYDNLKEFISIPLIDLVAPSSREFVRAQQEKAKKGEPYTQRFTYQILRKEGTVRGVEIALEHRKIGNEFFTQSTFRDITERDRAESALRESEERYRQLVEETVEGILVLDPEGKFIFVNTALCKMLGYSRKEMLAMNVLDTYPEPLREEGRTRTDLIRAGKPQHFERPMKRRDGTLLMIEGTGIRLENGNMQGIMHDITARNQAGEELRESEERYRLLFELSPDSISVYQEGKVLYANPATLRLLGFESQQEIIGKPMLEFVHPDYRELVIKRSQQQERNGKTAAPVEEKFIRRDGSAVDVEVMAAPFQYRGKPSHLVISRDISDRKRADEILREKEERFRATFENASVGVCVNGLDGRLLQVNQQMSKMFGYTREELEMMTVSGISYPEDAGLSPAFMQQAISGVVQEAGFDKRYLHKDGHIVWGHVSSSLVRDSQGNPLYFISHIQDITGRKEAERALRESEEKFAKLFQDAPVLIVITDIANGTCIDINEEALRVFGYRREEIVGKKLVDVGVITIESRALLAKDAQSRGKIDAVEMNFHAKDGRAILGLFRGERISIAGRDCILGAMVDITERKQAEETLRALAMRHAALLSAIPEIVMEVDGNKVYQWANPAGRNFSARM